MAVAGATGVYLLYTSLVLGWTGIGVGPASATPRRRRQRAQQWLVQAGLDDVRRRSSLRVMALLFVLGAGRRVRPVRRPAARAGGRRLRRHLPGRVLPGPPAAPPRAAAARRGRG